MHPAVVAFVAAVSTVGRITFAVSSSSLAGGAAVMQVVPEKHRGKEGPLLASPLAQVAPAAKGVGEGRSAAAVAAWWPRPLLPLLTVDAVEACRPRIAALIWSATRNPARTVAVRSCLCTSVPFAAAAMFDVAQIAFSIAVASSNDCRCLSTIWQIVVAIIRRARSAWEPGTVGSAHTSFMSSAKAAPGLLSRRSVIIRTQRIRQLAIAGKLPDTLVRGRSRRSLCSSRHCSAERRAAQAEQLDAFWWLLAAPPVSTSAVAAAMGPVSTGETVASPLLPKAAFNPRMMLSRRSVVAVAMSPDVSVLTRCRRRLIIPATAIPCPCSSAGAVKGVTGVVSVAPPTTVSSVVKGRPGLAP